MAIAQTIVFPENASSNPGFDRFTSLVTVKNIKDRYLHGVDLRDRFGKTIKNSAIEFFIDAIISYLEHELEMTITPTTYTEKHDYRSEEYAAWSFLQLRHKPVIGVTKVQLQIESGNALTDIPLSWVRLQNKSGQLQLAPTSGSLSEFNLGNGSFLPRLMMFNTDWPDFISITYIAGFEQDKIPAAINHLVGLLVAIEILNIAGDYILGAGISNSSITLDGLTETIGSTNTSGKPGYAGRIEQYMKQVKTLVDTLRFYYGKRIKVAIC